MNDLMQAEFDTVAQAIRQHAAQSPTQRALVEAAGGGEGGGTRALSYAQLDRMMDQVAIALHRDGVSPGQAIAICASTSIEYAAVFLGALRAGVVVAPLAPSSTPASLARMIGDAGALLVFTDVASAGLLDAAPRTIDRIAMDDSTTGIALSRWLAAAPAKATAASPPGVVQAVGGVENMEVVKVEPSWPFNIIYSSGTTGEPKGIVQSHGMRWMHVRRGDAYRYGMDTVMLLSTPLYSNTTLVVFFPTLAFGGTVLLMPKFDAAGYLQLAQTHRVTHTMLVPVQYQRLMARPDFDAHDLSSFKFKFCTSAPFAAALKADVLKRWPGGLVEFYGMTEGGGSFILEAHLHPAKLHTVGRAAQGHDVRLIDDEGRQVAAGEAGEVVGHSPGMMLGYHGQPEKTREAEWFDASGKRFIRTGDIGRLDADGFLTLFDRKKDMIISGGFNVYPSDLEAVLREHPGVLEAAVVGMPSEQWGETPVAFVVMHPVKSGQADSADALLQWVNARVGKTQRVAAVHVLQELPRSAIGKVLKRELRDQYRPESPISPTGADSAAKAI